jgi:hypothetical protein
MAVVLSLASTMAMAGLFSGLLGLVALVGWYTHSVTLVQVLPAFVPMQYNTALGFFLCGLAMLATARGWRRLAFGATAVVMAIGGLTLVEYVSGLDLIRRSPGCHRRRRGPRGAT